MSPVEAKELHIDIPEKILWLTTMSRRVKIAVGGRGSGKSTGVGDLMLGYAASGERVCCTREFQNSIDDSVHENLKIEIERLGMDNMFDVMANEVRSRQGGEIFYKGLARNITSLKSIAGVKKLWIEEGESVSDKSLRVLTPSIRSSAAANVTEFHEAPEIWITMNRGSSKDAVAKKYLARAEKSLEKTGYYVDDLMMVVDLNYQDNPWFPPELEQERQDDLENLPRAEYDHIWEGRYSDTVDNAIIEPEWFDACVDAHIKLGFGALGQERIAYDPADTGDAKAVAYSHGSVVKDVRSTDQGRIDTATDWATTFAIDNKPDAFIWDACGVGAGLARQITTALEGKKIELHAFNGGSGVEDPEMYYEPVGEVKNAKKNKETFINRRAQVFWMLRDRMLRTYKAIEKGEKVFSPDDLISFSSEITELSGLRAELCRIPRKYNASGRIQLMSKPDMKKIEIDSPNMADAVAMLMQRVDVKRKAKKINFSGWNG